MGTEPTVPPSCPERRPTLLHLSDGIDLAYRATPGISPTVVFLGGFSSDMTGTKASALEAWCRGRGRAFVRFDYSGHGASGGKFEEGTLGRWTSDALEVITRSTEGPLVLVGSSMGGWIMLLVTPALSDRIQGLVGIAAAPDFTDGLLLEKLPEEARRKLFSEGILYAPNPYGPQPTPITLRFVEEARNHLLLGSPIPIRCPVRLLHGLEDPDVPWDRSLRLARALESREVTITLVKNGDHRLSEPQDLELLFKAVEEICVMSPTSCETEISSRAPQGGPTA